jgi:hypothetical protein
MVTIGRSPFAAAMEEERELQSFAGTVGRHRYIAPSATSTTTMQARPIR